MYREQMGQGNSGETGPPRTTNSLCNKFQINVSEWKAKHIELGHNLFNFSYINLSGRHAINDVP